MENSTITITDEEQILYMLQEHALLEESVEVYIKKLPWFFTSHIVDLLPETEKDPGMSLPSSSVQVKRKKTQLSQ